MKTSELCGSLLDYWVGMACGLTTLEYSRDHDLAFIATPNNFGFLDYSPSRQWSQGGPIIEREGISIWKYDNTYNIAESLGRDWFAAMDGVHGWDEGNVLGSHEQYGATALIAAMRAYVASKFGEEVPDDLDAAH